MQLDSVERSRQGGCGGARRAGGAGMAQAQNPPSLFRKYTPSRTLQGRAQASCCLQSPPVVSRRGLSFQWAMREPSGRTTLAGTLTDPSTFPSSPIPQGRGRDSATVCNAIQSGTHGGQDMALGIPPLLHGAQDRKSDLSLLWSLEQRNTWGHWCQDLSLKCPFQGM